MKRVAIIGTGYWGKNLVRNFHALGVRDSIFDFDRSAAEALAETFDDIRVAKNLDEIWRDEWIQGVPILTADRLPTLSQLTRRRSHIRVVVEACP